MSKKVLGRGLHALIPQGLKETVYPEHQLLQIPVDQIQANPHQPRKQFDQEKIASLSESVSRDGVLQPVVVRRNGEQFELIMGERRLQAARLAKLHTAPAVVRGAEDVDALRLALVENLQRENLNPIEVAEAYKSLIHQFGLSQNELSDLVGKDRSSVANTIRLLALPEEVRGLIQNGSIREGHARALLSLTTAEDQLALARRIIAEKLNVREVEDVAGEERKAIREKKPKKEKPANITDLENAISSHLATRVLVEEKRGGKGKLVIEFYSHDDFERLAEVMNIPLPR